MNSNIKNTLYVTGIVVMFMLGLAAIQASGAYSNSIEPSSFRSFSVSGMGDAIGIPDVARFSFSVISEGGNDIASIQQDNTKKANKIIAFIKSSGVKDEDIRTENYNLSPRYQHFNCPRIMSVSPDGAQSSQPCPPSEIVGYTIHQSVSVKVRDFDKIGSILSGAVENGANSVSQLSFEIDDPTEVENVARAEAISKAKAKAEAIAKAGGFRLGKLLSIEEGRDFIPFGEFGRTVPASFDSSAEEKVQIEPGSQEVNITVTLEYEIQ